MKRLIIRILVILVLIEGAYVGIFNIVLNLHATQDYLNQMRPERITYHWERAWTWYPFRVDITNLTLNGQSWIQQWQLTAPKISGSFDIPALLTKTIRFHNIDTANVTVMFRPRPSPDRDDATVRAFYPTIPNRDPDAEADPVPTQSPGWRTSFGVGNVTGENLVWFGPIKMVLDGDVGFTMNKQNRNGPLSVDDGSVNVTFKELNVAGQTVATEGTLEGDFSLASYLPQEHRGLKLLPFLSMDAEIDLPVNGLDFLDIYLKQVSGMRLAGKGEIKGAIVLADGNLKAGTALDITTDDLTADLSYYSAEGDGVVAVTVAEAEPEMLNLDYKLSTLTAYHEPDHETLFTGKNLEISVARTPDVSPDENHDRRVDRVALTIPTMTVPDMKVYQRYLPDKWSAKLLSGSGSLEGKVVYATSEIDFDLTLRSPDAKVQFEDRDSFETGLAVGFRVKGEASGEEGKVDFTGTFIDLDDSEVSTEKAEDTDPWKANFSVSQGEAQFALKDPDGGADGFTGFWALFHEKDLKDLLATLDGMMKASLKVSDLDWVNLLLKNPYNLAIHNSAVINADLIVQSGNLAKGSTLQMPQSKFQVDVLDYVAEGTGGFDLMVEKGGGDPDIRLNANLTDASLRLQDEKAAVIEQMSFTLSALAQGVSAKEGGAVRTIELNIPSAKVTDMTAYNGYIPSSAPIRILGGTADMSAKLNIQESTSSGFVKLTTSRIETDLDGQRISGVIDIDVKIDGGKPEDKNFGIADSSLKLNALRVSGEHGPAGDWNGEIKFTKGDVTWKKPMKLDATLGLFMSDIRPIVSILEAQRKTHRWIERLLELTNVRGTAVVSVAPSEIVVPYSMIKADPAEAGVKGFIRDKHREGMIYARWGKLSGILEIDGDRKRFGLINAAKKFEEYKAGGPLPGMREETPSQARAERRAETPVNPPSPKRKPFSIFRRNR